MAQPDDAVPLDDSDLRALDQLQDSDLCEDCEEVLSDYYCNACSLSLCSQCWDATAAHRRKRLAPGQIPHEKTDLLLANRIQRVFSFAGDELTFERLHKDDEATAWFGLEREMKDGRPFMFRDHGRFADLATSSHNSLFKQRRPVSEGIHNVTNCIPSLVSFVGQTGAGKSTLVKLLIQFNQWSGRERSFPAPVPGFTGRDLPTSEDVHLYADPLTAGSELPILYADSEGLDGGEREPLAATLRKTREKRESESFGSELEYQPPRNYAEREVLWMTSKLKRTRQFAAGQLYPRVLFAFSDVVVFVHRNPRAIEGVLERLLEWGSVAIETTYNQPALPYAILALNATENDVDVHLWDVQASTRSLLDSLADTVNKNVEFLKYAELWRSRGKKIDTVEDLMMCYYSALRVVRLPTSGRPKLIEAQAQKLYLEIDRGCRLSRNVKLQTRMLLNAFEFQVYLNLAFDHFCHTIDIPFDFVQCSYLNSWTSTTLGDSILALAVNMGKQKPRPKASAIFERLACLIASCLLLDAVRKDLKGTAERIFVQYIPQLDAVLKEFGDRYWPCEFFVKGPVPAHLQAHLSNMAFQQSMRTASVIMRCANVRSGHAAKGHQLTDGRVFARGSYESSFSFERSRKPILDDIYAWFCTFMDKLSELSNQGYSREVAASAIHRDDVLTSHYTPNENSGLVALRFTAFCICCLVGIPEALLSCEHMLCRTCIRNYGESSNGHALVQILQCPLEVGHSPSSQPRPIYLRPEAAGVRVLALNNGGIRSVIQLELLKLIEKEFNGNIPIQSFFDMVIGEGTGGVLALGLVARGWTLDECERHLKALFERVFAPTNIQKFSGVSLLQPKSSHARYRARLLDETLRSIFSSEQLIVGPPPTHNPLHQSIKLAVLASSATGRKVLFSNYRRKSSSKLPYNLYPVTGYSDEPKVSDIARASMAHVGLFKPFIDQRLGPLFFKKDMSEGFLIEVAQAECQAIYPGLYADFPDVLLSLGCGRSKRPPPASIASNDTKQTQSSKRTKSERDEIRSLITEDSWETQAQYPRPNFISLNPLCDELPELDDITSMPQLQRLIQESTDHEIVRKLVAQLFATLFYAEADDFVQDTAAGEILVPIRVYCRLLDHTSEIHEVGRQLKSGAFRSSEFVFWEDGYGSQSFPISAQVLDKVIRDEEFTVISLLLPLWQPDAVVHGVLKLENGEEYPLSGFPRCLNQSVLGSKPAHKKDHEMAPTAMGPPWSAPSLRDLPSLGTWSSVLSLRSAGLSDQPGPVERSAQASMHEDEETPKGVTDLPPYSQ